MKVSKQTKLYKPSIRDMVNLDLPIDIRLSPDGTYAAVIVMATDWKANRYRHICHLYDTIRLTKRILNLPGEILQLEWLADGNLSFLLAPAAPGKSPQIWVYNISVRSAWVVSQQKDVISWFGVLPEGFLFLSRRCAEECESPRRIGSFEHFEKEQERVILQYLPFKTPARSTSKKLKQKRSACSITIMNEELSVVKAILCPTGAAVYLNCINQKDKTKPQYISVYRVDLKPHKGAVLRRATLLELPVGSEAITVSPDGQELLFSRTKPDKHILTQGQLWIAHLPTLTGRKKEPHPGGSMRQVAASLDRGISQCYWTAVGVFATYHDGTSSRILRIQPDGSFACINLPAQRADYRATFHANKNGSLGIIGISAAEYREAYLAQSDASFKAWNVTKLSSFGKHIANWDLGTLETIRWKTINGTDIEGVLRKPSNYDPTKRYPLVFMVHGGPNTCDKEHVLAFHDMRFYPTVQLMHKDVLVLEPNYRGSLGRGQAFIDQLIPRLGAVAIEDLSAAIEHLDAKGIISRKNIGCMGWSFGGYITAFAGVNTNLFKAVSCGAVASDYYTFYISSAVPHEVVGLLSTSPFHNRRPYVTTAPITNVKQARTPFLIQHGAEDSGVPVSCAKELYRGLQDAGVSSELYIYPRMGHFVWAPHENYAMMKQNFDWFYRHLIIEKSAAKRG